MVSSVYEAEAGIDAAKSNGAAPVEPVAAQELEEPHELLARIPPSDRDFDVFEDLVVGGSTTRATAYEFKISQTRVCQIVARVRQWIKALLGDTDGLTPEQQLKLAIGIAGDRLDFLYNKAIVGWNSTQGSMEKTQILPNGNAITTQVECYGEPRYLIAAGRLVLMRSKLHTSGLMNDARAAAADINLGPLPAEEEPAASDHPDGACSGNAEFGRRSEEFAAMDRARNAAARASYELPTHEERIARRDFFGPVQEDRLIEEFADLVRGKRNGHALSAAELVARMTASTNEEGRMDLKS